MHSRGAALLGAAFAVLALAEPGLAQDVTLTSRDGAIRIDGTLLGYDGEFYRVATRFGELTLDGTAVTCDGPGCPDLAVFVATARISGAAEIGQVLLPALVEAYANRNGLGIRRRVKSDTEFSYDLSDPEDGRPLLRLSFHLTSSAEGFADLIADEADLALSLREASAAEIARGREAGIGDLDAAAQMQVLALDALVPVVAPANPLTEIRWDGLAAVLAGEVTDWSALGGLEAPVALHLLRETDRLAIGPGGLLPAGTVVGADRLADAVASDPFALGLARYSDLGNARALPLVGLLRVSRRGECGDAEDRGLSADRAVDAVPPCPPHAGHAARVSGLPDLARRSAGDPARRLRRSADRR